MGWESTPAQQFGEFGTGLASETFHSLSLRFRENIFCSLEEREVAALAPARAASFLGRPRGAAYLPTEVKHVSAGTELGANPSVLRASPSSVDSARPFLLIFA